MKRYHFIPIEAAVPRIVAVMDDVIAMMILFQSAFQRPSEEVKSSLYQLSEKPCHTIARPELKEYTITTIRGRKRKSRTKNRQRFEKEKDLLSL